MDDKNKPELNPEQDINSFDAEPPTHTGFSMPDHIAQSTEQPVTTPTVTQAPESISEKPTSEPAVGSVVKQNSNSVPATPAMSVSASEPVVPVQPSGSPVQPPAEVSTAPKKSKKGLLIGAIIAIVIVVLFGGAALAYNFWYQNPDKVITDAIINASKAKSVVFNGTIDTSGDQKVKVVFDGNAKDGSGLMNVKLTVDSEGKTITIEGSALIGKDKALYIKVKDAKKLVTNVLGTYASAFDDIVAKIDNKWVKVTPDDLTEYSTQAKDTTNCVDKAYASFKDDKDATKEVTDVFKANRFIVVSKELPSQNGSLGYEIKIDESKTESFAKAFMKTKIYKQLHDCDAETFTDQYTAPTKSSDKSTEPTVQLWVSRFGHEFTKITSDSDTDGTKAHFDLQTVFNKDVSNDTPTEFVTVNELKRDIEALFSTAGDANSSSDTSY